MGHEIVKCSCGAIIRQCRCIGPHPVTVVPSGCEACKRHGPPLRVTIAETNVYRADLTDDECLTVWGAATRMGAGGPDGLADRAAIALVRLALADHSSEWSFPLWLCNATGEGGSNADVGPRRVLALVESMRVAARTVREARIRHAVAAMQATP